jgi:hypothetical protein
MPVRQSACTSVNVQYSASGKPVQSHFRIFVKNGRYDPRLFLSHEHNHQFNNISFLNSRQSGLKKARFGLSDTV